ncbi:DUF4192 family protein [Streptomyces sp. CA-253872]|uniref:DUF4192 domain-containing protein n=1 Tax=Streptomyces sp. CA-253872 TaxID=3240067 RepID=UPI003D8CBA79
MISLKSLADLADSLPYLLGYAPGNSVVLLALHGVRGRLGRRTAVRIPDDPAQWPHAAERVATMLLDSPADGPGRGDARHSRKRRGNSWPDGVIAFLFQEPEEAKPGAVPPPGAAEVREGLRPLAQHIRVACGRFDVPVVEALCLSNGRSWSYVTPLEEQEQAGAALLPAGSSVLAATSVYEGTPIPLPAAKLEGRLLPWRTAAAHAQERVLDLVALDLLPQILSSRENVLMIRRGTIGLLDNVLTRFATASVPSDPLEADLADDEALTHEEAARLVIGLQDREARDEAASFFVFPDAARRLWRALARRCVLSYEEHAAAPLSLVGWTAWSLGDESEARLALHLALAVDPHYTFAALLDQAFDDGIEPEEIKRKLGGCAARPAVRRTSAGPASACKGSATDGVGRVPGSQGKTGAPQRAEESPESGPGRESTQGRAGGGRRRRGATARPATRRRDARRPGEAVPGRPGGKAVKGKQGTGKEAYTRARRRLTVTPPGCERTAPGEPQQQEREAGRAGASDRRAAVDRPPLNGRDHQDLQQADQRHVDFRSSDQRRPDPQASDALTRPREEERPEANREEPTGKAEPSLTSSAPCPELPGQDAPVQGSGAEVHDGHVPGMERGREVPTPDGERDSRHALASGGERDGREAPFRGSGRGSQEAPASGSRRGGDNARVADSELADSDVPARRTESGQEASSPRPRPGRDQAPSTGEE